MITAHVHTTTAYNMLAVLQVKIEPNCTKLMTFTQKSMENRSCLKKTRIITTLRNHDIYITGKHAAVLYCTVL